MLNQGGGEALLVDTLGHVLVPSYSSRTAMHEAGHLLVAYLVGVLPRAYTTSSRDAFLRCEWCGQLMDGCKGPLKL